MSKSRDLPVCVVRTQDNAFKYYAGHDPILVPGKEEPLRMPLSGPQDKKEEHGVWHGEVHLCKRCGLLYVNRHGVSFSDVPKGPIAPGGTA